MAQAELINAPSPLRPGLPVDFVLGPEHNGILMTPEEFDAIEEWDEDWRYELIYGVLIVNAIPSPQQRGPNGELLRLLLNYHDSHPQGSSLDDTLDEEYIRVSHGRRRADRVIWTGLGRQPNVKTDIPSIAVEFVSAGRRNLIRDYEIKRDEYLALGILEYWVFDRFRRMLTVFQKDGDAYSETMIAEPETYRPALLPGFELPVARILAAADRWADQ